jgi:hypothetical protein
MDVRAHKIVDVQTKCTRHTLGDRQFYTTDIVATDSKGNEVTLTLFSDGKLTIENPEVEYAE